MSVSITESLARWASGDRSVETELMQHVYPVLRRIAQRQLGQSGPITLQATELANEAFIRLRSSSSLELGSREQFAGLAARVVRNLIIDRVRESSAQKRGGGFDRVDVSELDHVAALADRGNEVDWLALDAALEQLEKEEPKHARLVELRYFLGMSIEQAAAELGVSVATANRLWRFARAFLARHCDPPETD
ncbi:MAG: ECF-type sigma factor [Aquimonas sp.]|nr:ECF-type sigma factor [Aquimonas sp.]